MTAAILAVPFQFEGIGKLPDAARLAVDEMRNGNQVAGVEPGKGINRASLILCAFVVIKACGHAHEAIVTKMPKQGDHFILADVQALG
jgi:hypothetical protein